ncbi:Carboxypeptidase regulatory-like domain-containing protein [Halobellus clavatus]|uniref:Carboxypeptidase regulatory-like domain-containing protein n=1 Tax=Halobellus clavatus TaxID=660517 RepID=A0A1H3FFT2_9EURY|nr:Carboxypeptidase regulatory-like domain-containing protein [Halobellus clavatus]
MRVSRRHFCSTVAIGSSATLLGTASAQTDISVTGTVQSAAGADLSGVELRFSHENTGARRTVTLSSDGGFDLSLPEAGTYRTTLSNTENPTDGVPLIYSFESVVVDSTTNTVDLTVPRADEIQIRCVDSESSPVARLPVNFRAANGTGASPGLFTTTEQGYVSRFGADRPGVELAGETQVEVQPPANPETSIELGTVSVSQSDEFEFTITNPERYTYSFQLIEGNPDAGFHFPYFIYTPPLAADANDDTTLTRPFVVGFRLKDVDTTWEQNVAEGRDFIRSGRVRTIADELRAPALVALLPTNPPDESFELLDHNALQVTEPPYERLDRQLLSMISDARERLADEPYEIATKIHLLGFSDAGRMVDQFTMLHPDRVNAASSGGNGFATIPQDRLTEDIPRRRPPTMETLRWPVGTADLERLTGEAFDSESWVDVDQFRYIGAEDQGDPEDLEHPSDYTHAKSYRHFGDSRQQLLLDIFGWKQVDERFETSREIFDTVGATADFTVYDGVGHSVPDTVRRGVLDFHRRSMRDEYGPIPDTETQGDARDSSSAETRSDSVDSSGNDTQDEEAVSVTGPGFGLLSGVVGVAGAGYLLRSWLLEQDSDS